MKRRHRIRRFAHIVYDLRHDIAASAAENGH